VLRVVRDDTPQSDGAGHLKVPCNNSCALQPKLPENVMSIRKAARERILDAHEHRAVVCERLHVRSALSIGRVSPCRSTTASGLVR
jgi:hypothetical protein